MQYNIDINGEFAELFLEVKNILLSFKNIKETKKKMITSYFDEFSGICYLRTDENGLIIGFFKGGILIKKYPFLTGSGKHMKHLKYSSLKDLDKNLVKEIIEESIILNIEKDELNKLKKGLKHV